eukprot:454822_1
MKDSNSSPDNDAGKQVSRMEASDERRLTSTLFSWREYLSFLIIMGCQVASVQFYQSIASSAIGKSADAVSTMSICQYVPQLIINFTTPNWSKWISYKVRMIIALVVFVASFVVMIAIVITKNNCHSNCH